MLLQTIKGKIFGQKQKKLSKNVQDQKTLYLLLRNFQTFVILDITSCFAFSELNLH